MRKLALVLALLVAAPASAVVGTTTSTVEYTCNGTLKVFSVPFRWTDATHLVVQKVLIASPFTATTLTVTTDYTVSGTGNASGGTVTLVAPATSCPMAYKVRIRRVLPLTQPSALSTQGSFQPKTIEGMADRLTDLIQQLNDGALVTSQFNFANDASSGQVTPAGATTARSLSTQLGEIVNVRSFGCVGDGTTDDTACLRAALAAAGRAQITSTDWGKGLGGIVFMPRGVYRVTDTITWTTDATFLVGESKDTTAILLNLANAAKDGVVIGDGTGAGRRSGIRSLAIYSASTATLRDGLVINSPTWWRLDDVSVYQAGRYGLRIAGTYNGVGRNIMLTYCGDSGLYVSKDGGGTIQTTTDLHALYSSYNQKYGVFVQGAHPLNLYAPIIEYNGRNGTATTGDGIRVDVTGAADTTEPSEVNLFGPYFESNLGWDIQIGVGLTGGWHHVNASGARGAAGNKASGYGFYRGQHYSDGTFAGTTLPDYLPPLKTYRFEEGTSRLTITGEKGNIGASTRPEYYIASVLQALNQGRGVIDYPDSNGEQSLQGRHTVYIGGPGAATAIRFERCTAAPVSGTYAVGDMCFNSSPTIGNGREPIGWRCQTAGTPGTWEALFVGLEPTGSYAFIGAAAGANAVDASYRVYTLSVTSNLTMSLSAPNSGGYSLKQGRIFTVRLDNRSGGALTGITWAAAYKWAANAVPAAPANGRSLYVTFMTDDAGTSAYEVSRAVDVPW